MNIKEEMKQYYDTMRDLSKNEAYSALCQRIDADMEEFSGENPSVSPLRLKSRFYTALATHFEPIIFKNSPFFYEMGVRNASDWGIGGIGGLYREKRRERVAEEAEYSSSMQRFDLFCAQIGQDYKEHVGLYRMPSPGFDIDHNSIGYREMLTIGVDGIVEKINTELMRKSCTESQREFYLCALEGCQALIKIAEKFADKAERTLHECENDTQRKYMQMMAEAARRVPKNPPASFYEGLASIWFLREVIGNLESVGISVLGQIDMLVGDLYERDIQSGVITEAEAEELMYLWLIPSDIKFDSENDSWPESSTCIALGGCDVCGAPVFNDVTKMIIKIHGENHMVVPKLNLRYSKNSPDEYIDLISKYAALGHNNFALSCDDIVIPSLMRAGVSEEDARAYLNGGCQETMVEGKGHTAGAYIYIILPSILDNSMNKCEVDTVLNNTEAMHRMPRVITKADNYEDFYEKLLYNMKKVIGNAISDQVVMGKRQKDINPCPLFSSMHEGCVEKGLDYTEGGAKYNLSTVCLCGIATLIDSLYSIKTLVYDKKAVSLDEMRSALLNNWEGYDDLRKQCIRLPKYGHGNFEVDIIAKRVIDDLNKFVNTLENERGGKNILSAFSYYLFKTLARCVRATPDGRMCGDYLSQGISASRIGKTKSAFEILDTMKTVGYNLLSGISVVDLMLDENIGEKNMSAFIRTFGTSGCPNLQLNVISRDKLIEAQKFPNEYAHLMVRVSGLSLYFVNLERSKQNEIISRRFSSV